MREDQREVKQSIHLEEETAQWVMQCEPSPLLEHSIPAKEVGGKEQLSEVVGVHLLNLVSVASLQVKLLRMCWLMTVLEIL